VVVVAAFFWLAPVHDLLAAAFKRGTALPGSLATAGLIVIGVAALARCKTRSLCDVSEKVDEANQLASDRVLLVVGQFANDLDRFGKLFCHV
jgi:hypothetical protein